MDYSLVWGCLIKAWTPSFFCNFSARKILQLLKEELQMLFWWVLITRILEIQELFRIYTVKMLHIFLCCLTFLLPSIFEGEATRGAISIEQHRHLRLFLVGFLFRFTFTEQKRNNFRAKMTKGSFSFSWFWTKTTSAFQAKWDFSQNFQTLWKIPVNQSEFDRFISNGSLKSVFCSSRFKGLLMSPFFSKLLF